jgi:hypothetical protein
MTERIEITETGCHLDNHRGHYITRDMIELAVEFGFIIGEMEKFVLSMYEDHNSEEGYPFESVQELADEALTWLNCGDNDGPDRQIKFQNNPPVIPNGTAWAWNDGDFGLYWIETEGECPICQADGGHLSDKEKDNIESTTGEPWWVRNCTH